MFFGICKTWLSQEITSRGKIAGSDCLWQYSIIFHPYFIILFPFRWSISGCLLHIEIWCRLQGLPAMHHSEAWSRMSSSKSGWGFLCSIFGHTTRQREWSLYVIVDSFFFKTMVISNFEITTKKKDSEDPSVFFGCLHDFHPLWLPTSARASPSFDGFTTGLQAVKCWWIASTATSTRQPLLGAWWLWWFTPWFTSFVETSRSDHWGWLNVRNIRWPSDLSALSVSKSHAHFQVFSRQPTSHTSWPTISRNPATWGRTTHRGEECAAGVRDATPCGRRDSWDFMGQGGSFDHDQHRKISFDAPNLRMSFL